MCFCYPLFCSCPQPHVLNSTQNYRMDSHFHLCLSHLLYQDRNYPLLFHLNINYSSVRTQLMPHFLFEACAHLSALISTSFFFPCNFVLIPIKASFHTYSQACSHPLLVSFSSLKVEVYAFLIWELAHSRHSNFCRWI